jgi:hypothetical protein
VWRPSVEVLDRRGGRVGVPASLASSDASVAAVTPDGTIELRRPGIAVIRAAVGGVARETRLRVLPAVPAALELDLAARTLEVGEQAVCSARVHDRHGRPLADVPVRWRSTDPGVATVSDAGLVSATTPGRVVIEAACERLRASAALDVRPAEVTTLDLTPPAALRVGERVALDATPRDRRGRTLARPVRWASADPAVLSVAPDGTAAARAPGGARVTAECEGKRASAEVWVMAASVTELFEPASASPASRGTLAMPNETGAAAAMVTAAVTVAGAPRPAPAPRPSPRASVPDGDAPASPIVRPARRPGPAAVPTVPPTRAGGEARAGQRPTRGARARGGRVVAAVGTAAALFAVGWLWRGGGGEQPADSAPSAATSTSFSTGTVAPQGIESVAPAPPRTPDAPATVTSAGPRSAEAPRATGAGAGAEATPLATRGSQGAPPSRPLPNDERREAPPQPAAVPPTTPGTAPATAGGTVAAAGERAAPTGAPAPTATSPTATSPNAAPRETAGPPADPASGAPSSATAAAAAAEARAGMERAITAYAAAIRGRNLADLRRAFPEMPDEVRRDWEGFFKAARSVDAQVQDLHVAPAEGDTGTAELSLAVKFPDPATRRTCTQVTQLRVRLARAAGAWHIRTIDQLGDTRSPGCS